MIIGQHCLHCITDNSEIAKARAEAFANGYRDGFRAGRVDCANDDAVDAYDRGKTDGYLQAMAEIETEDYEFPLSLVG